MGGLGMDIRTRTPLVTPRRDIALFGGPGLFPVRQLGCRKQRPRPLVAHRQRSGEARCASEHRDRPRGNIAVRRCERAYGIWPGETKTEVFAADRARQDKKGETVGAMAGSKEVTMKAMIVTSDRVFVACSDASEKRANSASAPGARSKCSTITGTSRGVPAARRGGDGDSGIFKQHFNKLVARI